MISGRLATVFPPAELDRKGANMRCTRLSSRRRAFSLRYEFGSASANKILTASTTVSPVCAALTRTNRSVGSNSSVQPATCSCCTLNGPQPDETDT